MVRIWSSLLAKEDENRYPLESSGGFEKIRVFHIFNEEFPSNYFSISTHPPPPLFVSFHIIGRERVCPNTFKQISELLI